MMEAKVKIVVHHFSMCLPPHLVMSCDDIVISNYSLRVFGSIYLCISTGVLAIFLISVRLSGEESMLEMNMPQCIYVSDCLSTTAATTMMFLNNRDFQRYALLECTTCQYFDIIFQEQVTKFMCNLCSNGSNTCKSLYRALTFKGVKI